MQTVYRCQCGEARAFPRPAGSPAPPDYRAHCRVCRVTTTWLPAAGAPAAGSAVGLEANANRLRLYRYLVLEGRLGGPQDGADRYGPRA